MSKIKKVANEKTKPKKLNCFFKTGKTRSHFLSIEFLDARDHGPSPV
jgi:hypothetical protein